LLSKASPTCARATRLATTTPDIAEGSFTTRFFASLFSRLTQWFADATNGIQNFFAHVGNFGRVNTDELCTKKSDGTEVCASGDQLAEILSASAAAGAPHGGGEAPSGSSAFGLDANTATSTAQSDSELITSNSSSTPEATSTPEAANDNQSIADAESEPEVQEPTLETHQTSLQNLFPFPYPLTTTNRPWSCKRQYDLQMLRQCIAGIFSPTYAISGRADPTSLRKNCLSR